MVLAALNHNESRFALFMSHLSIYVDELQQWPETNFKRLQWSFMYEGSQKIIRWVELGHSIQSIYKPALNLTPLHKSQIKMDRSGCCVVLFSLIIIPDALYMGYQLFISSDNQLITHLNYLRLCIFLAQHAITQYVLVKLIQPSATDESFIRWLCQMSVPNLLLFVTGEVICLAKGGKLFMERPDMTSPTIEFEVTWLNIYFQINTNFLMFLIIAVVVILIIRCKEARNEQRGEFVIEQLQSETYVEENQEGQHQNNPGDKATCSICLTDLQLERVIKLPCDHYFHKECLVEWLKKSTVCPLCRLNIDEELQRRNNHQDG